MMGMSWMEVHEALPLTVVHLRNEYKTSMYSKPISIERPRTGRPPKHQQLLLKKEKGLFSIMQRILLKPIVNSLIQRGSWLAHLYGLSKTHKKKLAVCPILLATGTYNYKLAKWLDSKLKPLSITNHTVSVILFANDLHTMKIGN